MFIGKYRELVKKELPQLLDKTMAIDIKDMTIPWLLETVAIELFLGTSKNVDLIDTTKKALFCLRTFSAHNMTRDCFDIRCSLNRQEIAIIKEA